jgi:hypothetical protein
MKRLTFPLIASLALLLGAPAMAQTDQQQSNQQQGDQTRQGQAMQGMDTTMNQGRRVVVGTVEDMRDVTLKGIKDSQRLIKINANDNTVFVNLGAVNNQLPTIESGDRIVVIGNSSRINGNPVIQARFIGEVYSYVPVIYDVAAGS